MPGALVMFAAGSLIAVNTLNFWPVFCWAVSGAILGDGLSYWLGRHYHHHIVSFWPFNKHPDWLEKSHAFFRRHGSKSVFLGRFIGPIRPVIPVVAGMLDLPPQRFYLANILSALGWAPLYLLIGMAFGSSMVVAGEIAGRLVLLLGLLLISAWGIVSLIHIAHQKLQPHAVQWGARLLAWGRIHTGGSWFLSNLYDPNRPVSGTLLLWAGILFGSSWLFLEILEDVATKDPLVLAGHSFFEFFQQLRTPLGDQIMVIFTELGDSNVTIPVVVIVLVWMLWQRAWVNAGYWLATIGFAVLAVGLLKHALHFPRPVSLYYTGVDSFSFPSGHTTMSTVVYTYLAMLTAESLPIRKRWFPYALAAVLIAGIGISRLYLGAHWIADVLGGVGFGIAWVALLTIARHHHLKPGENVRGVAIIATIVFIAAGIWHIQNHLQTDLKRYAVHHTVEEISEEVWWVKEWQTVPAYRIDLEGEQEQPLNVQWAGDLPKLQQELIVNGWHEPPPLTIQNALHWILPNPSLDQLPIIPNLHNGHYEALVLVKTITDPATSSANTMILRLWPTNVQFVSEKKQLWIGTITELSLLQLPLITIPRATVNYTHALEEFKMMISLNLSTQIKHSVIENIKQKIWNGDILLIRDNAKNNSRTQF